MNDPFASLIIRPGAPGDLNRVRKDWLLSYARSNFARYLTPRDGWETRASNLYWSWQREIVERLLTEASLWIASWGEDQSTIVGWCVEELGVAHYVYVGEDYRKRGIAKRLLAPLLERREVTYTHRTPVCRHLPIPPGWSFDPRVALARKEKVT